MSLWGRLQPANIIPTVLFFRALSHGRVGRSTRTVRLTRDTVHSVIRTSLSDSVCQTIANSVAVVFPSHPQIKL